MQIALTRLDQALRDEPAQLIATVHDEAVLLVPDDIDSVERIGAIAQQEMIAAFLEVFPDAPTLNLVDPKVGPTWGDLQPLPDWLHSHRSSGGNTSPALFLAAPTARRPPDRREDRREQQEVGMTNGRNMSRRRETIDHRDQLTTRLLLSIRICRVLVGRPLHTGVADALGVARQ